MRLLFFGGKGGVGKTTCAAARALAEASAGCSVLVVSTDPAHSLGDVLKKKLSSRVTKVAQGLHALELDARRAFARWLREHRRPLGDILEQGTWLDREDVEALLDLSIPGIDELAGLLEIARLSRSGAADVVIVDTAPTGHTLRLLAAPETVGAVAHVLDALHEEHRLIRDQLARVGRPEASDRLIALLEEQAREMAAQLRDPQTMVHWVTLPEELSVAEAEDAVRALERARLHISEIIVNRVLPAAAPCPLCDRRRSLEWAVLANVRRGIGRGRHVSVVPAEIDEPIGAQRLARIGRVLTAGRKVEQGFSPANVPIARLKSRAASDRLERAVPAECIEAFTDAKLLFVGGKGGVGKTTVAAAIALRLARADPGRRVLLMSVDPAHSLGDVLRGRIGDTPSAAAGAPANLRVRELDATRAWLGRRAAVEAAIDDLAATLGSGVTQTSARVSELMDLAPPGVDELFGVLSVFEARDEYDCIVIDTAPTGHALRLLATPDVVSEWVQALLRVLLKYRALIKPGQLAAELVGMSRSIRDLRQFLRNHRLTRFIVVTRPAVIPLAETTRLLRQLRRIRLAVPAVVANALTLSPGRCARCRTTAAAERRHLGALRRALGGLAPGGRRIRRVEGPAIIQTPLTAPPPRGARALERWASQWSQNPDS